MNIRVGLNYNRRIRYKDHKRVNMIDKTLGTLSEAEQPTTESDESVHGFMDIELKTAAEEGDVDRLMKILEDKKQQAQITILKQRDSEGNTCVHIAAKNGRNELIGYLTTLSNSRDFFEQKNDEGDNALHTVAKAGHLFITNRLIRYGEEAGLDYMGQKNGEGNLPLHEALLHKCYHVVDLLFHLGARHSFCLNKERKSPFNLCLEAGKIKTFDAVLKADTGALDDVIETQFMKEKSVLDAAISWEDEAEAKVKAEAVGLLQRILHLKDKSGQSSIRDLLENIPTGSKQSPDFRYTPFTKGEQEDGEGVKQSSDWHGIDERMMKLQRATVSTQSQGMHQHFMDFDLYEAAKRGDVDGFISALEKYSEETKLALTTIFGQITPLQNTFLHVASRYGHKDLTRLITCYFPSLLDRENCHGNTALHLAAREGNLGVVEILVEQGVQIGAENGEGRTPSQLAQSNCKIDVVDFLINGHVEVAYQVNKNGDSLLHDVVQNGHTKQLNKIFSAVSHCFDQKDLDVKLTKGKSLVLAAILSRKIEILQELARQKPLLFNIKHEERRKLVHFAELFGFHEAANCLRTEFKLEIIVGDAKSSDSYSLDAYPLSIPEDPEIENIWQLMQQKRRDERMSELIRNVSLQNMPSRDLENSMHHKLYEATKKGDVDSFIGALENISQNSAHLRTILQQKTQFGNTFLHVAAINGHKDFTAFIVFYSRKLLREKNEKGNTAIHEAARAGHLGVIQILNSVNNYHQKLYNSLVIGGLQNDIREELCRADWVYTSTGNTSVLEAIANNQRKVIDYLIKSSVKEACHVNKEGKSGLYFAVEAGMVDAVKTILSSITADGNLKYICELTNGKSLLNAATRKRSKVMFQEILSKIPAQIHVVDEDGETPLSFAVSTGFLEGLNCLVDKFIMDTSQDEFNMVTSQKDSSGYNLVHNASKSGNVHILGKLMQNHPDAELLVNGEGQNILHIAAIFGRDNVVKFILKSNWDLINEKDNDGNTPLHLATLNWRPKVVSSLTWDPRVNLELVNNMKLTALDIAEECREPITYFHQLLTWTALMLAGTPRVEYKNRKVSKNHNLSEKDEQYPMGHSKDRVNTLLLMATLIATVAYAAGFTMPGGYNNSGPKEGQATLLRKLMFQTFVICDTIALYSSITVAVTLIWAQLGDLNLVVHALRFALPLLSISLTTMSVAFMVGVSLVVESLTWLACFVLIFGIFSLASLLTLFIPLCFPLSSKFRVLRYITYYIFHLLVLASGSSYDIHIKEEQHQCSAG